MDIVTGFRNTASTKICWYSLLGGKAVTAPCNERINDHYNIKIYSPQQEADSKKRTMGIIAGVVGVVGCILGLLVGRWWGGHIERKRNAARQDFKRESDYSDKRRVRKRETHPRDFKRWDPE